MRSYSRSGLLRYKIAPKYPLSGPFDHSGVSRDPGWWGRFVAIISFLPTPISVRGGLWWRAGRRFCAGGGAGRSLWAGSRRRPFPGAGGRCGGVWGPAWRRPGSWWPWPFWGRDPGVWCRRRRRGPWLGSSGWSGERLPGACWDWAGPGRGWPRRDGLASPLSRALVRLTSGPLVSPESRAPGLFIF